MIRITVSASKKYDVLMEKGILKYAGAHIRNALGISESAPRGDHGKKICIVTDAVVNPLYAGAEQALQMSLKSAGFDVYKYVFTGGENSKNMRTVEEILDYLTKKNFSRSDVLLALGGGITGDITGFAAAVYLRGIDYIQVPTTLLAIVDSSVGGKTGVNLKAGKNLAGAFWQPRLVLFDPDVLSTLPYDIMLDGIAEAVKAGMIADKLILESVKFKRSLNDPEFLMNLAFLAIEVKKRLVEEDERDTGSRQLLNFGHTIAHAIEKCSDYRIRHGQAVATGMAIVSIAADRLDWTVEKCSQDVIDILERFGFKLTCPFSAWELANAALQDKKIRGGEITLVVPVAVGRCRLKTIPVSKLEPFISYGING